MRARSIAPGMSLVEVPEAGLCLLCGCPENAVKHLMKAGAIAWRGSGTARYETGPNAILLSERPIIDGRFANAAEFPVLQMLYRQGMLIPSSPAHTGQRPILIGLPDQIEAQARYIHLGNYGLSSLEELLEAGFSPEVARERLALKLAFSMGTIKPLKDFLDLRPLDARAVEVKGGVFVQRLGANRYAVIHAGSSVEVDLEGGGRSPGAPYSLPRKAIPEADFAVVHLGEGDGWDPHRPCMSSLLVAGEDRYLVDAGPDILASLRALGLGLGDLTGILQTHVHDDHFIGLAALFRSPRRLAYYAVPGVRASAARKLAALAGIGEGDFRRYFEVHDLEEGAWNPVGVLEVKPIYSPHPVETSLLRIRRGGRTYAHWADLTSFRVLDSFVRDDPEAPGISAAAAAGVKAAYLEAADLKKLDVGGGMIHGDAEDYASDPSADLLFSHTDTPGAVTLPFGRMADFGEASILVPSGPSKAEPPEAPARRDGLTGRLQEALEGVDLGQEGLGLLSRELSLQRLGPGADLGSRLGRGLAIIEEGRVELRAGGEVLTTLGPGDLWGEEATLYEEAGFFSASALGEVVVAFLPAVAVELHPSLLWRLKELHARRLAASRASFRFEWRPSYSVGSPVLDAEHQELFASLAALQEGLDRGATMADLEPGVAEARRLAEAHYVHEEALMAAASFPGLAEHRRVHQDLLADLDLQVDLVRRGLSEPSHALDLAKEKLLGHSLLMDRQYRPWLAAQA